MCKSFIRQKEDNIMEVFISVQDKFSGRMEFFKFCLVQGNVLGVTMR